MHELSICQAIVEQVERIARQHDAHVSSVTLRVGPLSGVEAPLLERAYPLAIAGTPLSSSRLVIDLLPVRVRCRACGQETPATPNRMLCGDCGDWHTELVSGDELVLASVELERGAVRRATLQ